MSSTRTRREPGAVPAGTSLGIAIGVHVAALLLVPEFRQSIRDLATTTGDFIEVEPEPPAPPPPPPDRPPPVPREREEVVRPEAASPDEPPPPLDQASEPPPDILEAEGLELSNSTFTMPANTGAAPRTNQSGVYTGNATQGTSTGSPDGVPGGTGPALVTDLSVRAEPPSNMNAILDRHFPSEARQQGVQGTASVTVEVRPDGSVGRVQRGTESVSGFNFMRACIDAVREMQWTPARDQSGNTVGSSRSFRCRFDISR